MTDILALVAELRRLPVISGSWVATSVARAADALEAQAREIGELRGDLAACEQELANEQEDGARDYDGGYEAGIRAALATSPATPEMKEAAIAAGWPRSVIEKHPGLARGDVVIDPASSPAAMGGVRVKPLEWVKGTYTTTDDDGGPREGIPRKLFAWRAGGYLIIQQDSPDGMFLLRGLSGGTGLVKPYLEAAKAAAQADYESRILSALSPATAATRTSGDAIKNALRILDNLDRQNIVNDRYASDLPKAERHTSELWLICNSHVKDRSRELRAALSPEAKELS